MYKNVTGVLFILTCYLFSGCSEKNTGDPAAAKGSLKITVDFDISVKEKNPELKSTLAIEDFRVIIYNSEDQEVRIFERAGDIPSQVELPAGNYYVVAHSDNYQPAAFESPYFYGRSENFSLEASANRQVSVLCSLANCSVSIIYSDNVKQTFTDYSTEAGTAENKLVFTKDETRKGYFELKPIGIRATLTYTGAGGSLQNKILTGNIPMPEAGKHYEIAIDARQDNGYSNIAIVLDETETTEVINLTDGNPDDIGYGDLLITEIMYNPQALDDAYGEWFEIFNNSSQMVNLNTLVINRAANRHVISGDIPLAPGAYYVLARTDGAYDGTKYVYGSDITLTNTTATLALSTYGSDGTNGQELASVTYGTNDFPDQAGASISLDPGHFDVEEAKSGTSWCVASAAYNTGDLGTPGLPNTGCE